MPPVPIKSWCHFCGNKAEEGKIFCTDEHEKDFASYKATGKKLSIKVDAKTTIFTTKYDRVGEIVERLKQHINDPLSGLTMIIANT